MYFLSLIFSLLLFSNKKIIADPDSTSVNKIILLRLINEARKKGCTCGDTYYAPTFPLTWNEKLEKAAVDHSNDMFQKKYFSHIAPDGSNGGDRMMNAGYAWKFYGENIAEGFTSEQKVVDGWLHSADHCKNIMSSNYKEMGIGRSGNYWTQDFGSK